MWVGHARRPRATIAAVMLAVVATSSACASRERSASDPASDAIVAHVVPATATRVFAPFTPGGAPTAGVVAHRSGSCFTNSITVSSARAYRCFAGNEILDPCFVSARARQLDCYPTPWSRPTALTVARSLPKPIGATHIERPWAIELVGGVRCVVTSGTTSVVRGVALGYRCPTGTAGLARTSSASHTALFSGRDGALHDVAVTVEWRG